MTIDQLRDKLKFINDKFGVELVEETQPVVNESLQVVQENKGDLKIELDGRTLMVLTKKYDEPAVEINNIVVGASWTADFGVALEVICHFLTKWED